MSNHDATWDGLWLQTGLTEAEAGHAPEQTIRRASAETTHSHCALPHLSISEDPEEGDVPDGVQLVVRSLLGEGGMGRVHLASQPLLDREVAIKRVKVNGPAAAQASLLREARYMGSLEHPNIVPVHALVADDRGNPILVMKRIAGTEWRDLIADPSHPAWAGWNGMAAGVLPRNIEILISVCRAMQFAHEKGVLHRDLKPENVMIGHHGSVYVLDWGIATRTSGDTRGPLVGTPAFMPPEMVDVSAPLSETTDVYLLGACLHQVLTGVPPHRGTSLKEVLEVAHRSAPPVFGPDVPPGLAQLCTRCLSAEPSERPPSVKVLAEALVGWIRNRGSEELASRAAEALERLEAALSEAAIDPQAVAAAFSESRFGYRQALETWPENAPASAGLKRALTLMFHFEIDRHNLDHAHGLLQELSSPSDLVDILGQARDEQDQRDALAHGQDLSVSVRQRTALLVGLGIVTTLISMSILQGGLIELSEFETRHMVRIGVGFYTVILVFVGIGRKWLFRNQVNKAMTLSILVVSAAVVLGRMMAYLNGLSVAQTFSQELLLMGGALGVVGAFTRQLGFWVGAGMAAAAGLACVVWPSEALQIFGSTMTVGFGAGAAHSYWSLRK